MRGRQAKRGTIAGAGRVAAADKDWVKNHGRNFFSVAFPILISIFWCYSIPAAKFLFSSAKKRTSIKFLGIYKNKRKMILNSRINYKKMFLNVDADVFVLMCVCVIWGCLKRSKKWVAGAIPILFHHTTTNFALSKFFIFWGD